MGLVPRVVFDTNIWLSGLLFGGNAEKLLELFIVGDLVVVCSEELVSELRRVVARKFPLFSPQLSLLEASIRKDAWLVQIGHQPISVCRDPDDNMILETALVGSCSHIITGDDDLLSIGEYEGVQICKASHFLANYIRA